MSLSIGIVGLPNVGKSTLFNALLKQSLALAANYPFATIEPNVGIAQVPDERLAVLAKIVGTQVLKPATIEFIDIAGLVAGASKGEGLGNKFLAHIRETSAIAHVLRVFSDTDVIREGSKSPEEDLETIRLELQLADLATLEKQKEPRGNSAKSELEKWQIIEKMGDFLRRGKNVNEWLNSLLDEEQERAQKIATELNLLTSKPEIFVFNVDEQDLAKEKELRHNLAAKMKLPEKQMVIVSAKIEAELSVLSEEDQTLFFTRFRFKTVWLSEIGASSLSDFKLTKFFNCRRIGSASLDN